MKWYSFDEIYRKKGITFVLKNAFWRIPEILKAYNPEVLRQPTYCKSPTDEKKEEKEKKELFQEILHVSFFFSRKKKEELRFMHVLPSSSKQN